MKKITFLLFIITFSVGVTIFAQNVPNGNFEEWEQGASGFEVPVDWETLGNDFGIQDVYKVAGQNGNFAMELKPIQMSGLPTFFGTFAFTGFEINERPATFGGYIKGSAAGDDTLSILITFVKDGNPMGYGFKEVSQDINDFTSFTLPIQYSGSIVPDSALIIITLSNSDGNATEGSAYTLDNLTLNGVAGINDPSNVFGQIENAFPNPATSTLTIPVVLTQPDQLELTVFDAQGKKVVSEDRKYYNTGLNEIVLDVSNLNHGFYFYSIAPTDGKGFTKTFVVK